MTRRLMKTTALCATTLALSMAFVAAPTIMGVPGFDDAAHAKNGKGGGGNDKGDRGGGRDKGDRGGKGGSKGGSDKGGAKAKKGGGKSLQDMLGFGKSKKQKVQKTTKVKKAKSTNKVKGSAKKTAAAAATTAVVDPTLDPTLDPTVDPTLDPTTTVDLHPKQKGRWNANPNQNAIDAHIRNQNFNGTVGMLSQYELALKAQDPEAELNEYEQAALDNLLGSYGFGGAEAPTDADITDFLNESYGDETLDATYSYEDGVVSCAGADCGDSLDEVQAGADLYNETETDAAEEANEGALGDLLAASEQNILDNSNKSTAGIEDPLLDTIAGNLGFDRQGILAEQEEEPVPGEDITEDLDPIDPVDPVDGDGDEGEEVVIIIEE